MTVRFFLLLATTACIAFPDVIVLRNGKTVQGSYLGGNSRQVRMVIGESVQSFALSEVARIEFEGEPSSPSAAAAVVPERPRVLRPSSMPAPAPVSSTAASREIAAGTQITIRMIDDVDSKDARPGQTYRASVDEEVLVGDRVVIERGADVVTKLVEVKDPSKLSGGGQLTLDLASITVNGKAIEVLSEGVTTTGESRTGQSAKVIGGTAALGAIIGAIAGGGKGAAIGAASGAGAGTAIQVVTQGPQVRIPAETRLTFTLQRPIRL